MLQEADDLAIPRPFPVIALCDLGSQTNWISQKFLNNLAETISTDFKPTSRRGRAGGVSHINIRWTCQKLEQISEVGTFYIEPNAHFNILFGCGYEIRTDPKRRIFSLPSPYGTAKQKRNRASQLSLSKGAAESFRRGTEDGTLLPLKPTPSFSTDGLFMTIAELEPELKHVYGSFTTTEELLSSIDDAQRNPPYVGSSTMNLPSRNTEIPSSRGSTVTDNDERFSCVSTNTSLSEELYKSHNTSERLSRERCGSGPLEGWFGQSIHEEPQPLLSRMLQSQRRFTRIKEVSSSPRQLFPAERESLNKTWESYWQWDEEAKNYKHFDEGNAEPVWYNPP